METPVTLCAGWIRDPAGRGGARRCGVPLDPALAAAGYRTHPGCDPDEPWCRTPHDGPHQAAELPSGALVCTIEPEAG